MGETGSASAMAPVRLWSGLCVSHAASAGLRASPAWSVLHSPGRPLPGCAAGLQSHTGSRQQGGRRAQSHGGVLLCRHGLQWECTPTAIRARPGGECLETQREREGPRSRAREAPGVSIRPEYPLERSGLYPTGPRVPELVDGRSTGCSSKRGCRKTGLSAHLQ